MPRHYMYRCNECGHTERRYRNSTKCRKCGGDIVRLTTNGSHPTTECSHAPPKVISARDLVVQLRFEIDRLGWQVRALEAERDELVADRDAVVELLLGVGFETASGAPVQLAAQVRELVRALESVIERAIHSMRWLWGFWDGNTVIPAPSADREMVAQAWEGLAMAVGDLVEALGHDPDPSKRGKLDERVEVVSP